MSSAGNDNKIKIIIADDHEVYRDGLGKLFDAHPQIELVGEAANGKALVEMARQRKPDVALTDLWMPVMSGVEAISEISKLPFKVKCISNSTFEYEQIIVHALEAGARGYLSKNSGKEEIIEAIQTVYEGYYYHCRRTTSRMMKLISLSKYNPDVNDILPIFKEREKEIIRLICQRKTSEEIAEILYLSKKTIDKYRLSILDKIKERSSVGIVIYAIKNGLYSPEEETVPWSS